MKKVPTTLKIGLTLLVGLICLFMLRYYAEYMLVPVLVLLLWWGWTSGRKFVRWLEGRYPAHSQRIAIGAAALCVAGVLCMALGSERLSGLICLTVGLAGLVEHMKIRRRKI